MPISKSKYKRYTLIRSTLGWDNTRSWSKNEVLAALDLALITEGRKFFAKHRDTRVERDLTPANPTPIPDNGMSTSDLPSTREMLEDLRSLERSNAWETSPGLYLEEFFKLIARMKTYDARIADLEAITVQNPQLGLF